MRGNISGMDNMTYVPETNYSILANSTDVWHGELPFKTGDKFPTEAIKERALVSNTNRMIYENNVDEIYANILSIFPEIEPMQGLQVREISTNLPYFKNATNYWTGLIAGESPAIDGSDEVDIKINEVIENSNWATTIQNEVRSRFMDTISAYRVDTDINGKPTIIAIEAKNLICYVSKEYTTSIEVNVVFNIYKDNSGEEYVEFIEYHFNGKIKKTVYKYDNGIIGRHIEERDEETEAYGGKYKLSPIVVFRHNTVNNQIYGTDQYRFWSPSILGTMRQLQNVLRLGERTREMIRKVPDSAISKNSETGSSYFFNKGTVSYADGQDGSPDIEYIVPEIRMTEAIQALEKSLKSVSIDTNLGPVFFDLEKLGSNLSAKSIEAALYPTKIEARRIKSEMEPYVKELVVRLCLLADVDISNTSSFSIMWFDGFPQDVQDYTNAIQKRLGDKQSISLQDAIIKLDKVPSRIAMQKVREIEGLSETIEDINEEAETILDNIEGQEIRPTAGISVEEERRVIGDNTLWENQMPIAPRDISPNSNKGVSKEWIKRKLRQKNTQ